MTDSIIHATSFTLSKCMFSCYFPLCLFDFFLSAMSIPPHYLPLPLEPYSIRAQDCQKNLRFCPRLLHTKAMTSVPAPGRMDVCGRSRGSNSSGNDPSGDGPRPGTPQPLRARRAPSPPPCAEPSKQVIRLDHLFHCIRNIPVSVTYHSFLTAALV